MGSLQTLGLRTQSCFNSPISPNEDISLPLCILYKAKETLWWACSFFYLQWYTVSNNWFKFEIDVPLDSGLDPILFQKPIWRKTFAIVHPVWGKGNRLIALHFSYLLWYTVSHIWPTNKMQNLQTLGLIVSASQSTIVKMFEISVQFLNRMQI